MLTSKEVATKYGVSIRTAQRWLKQGFNETVCSSNIKTTNSDTNDRILKLLETQNRLIETMLVLIDEIRSDKIATSNVNIRQQTTNSDASSDIAVVENYIKTSGELQLKSVENSSSHIFIEKQEKNNKNTINPIIPFVESEATNTNIAEVQKSKSKTNNQYSSDFEEFWNIYPRTPNSSKIKAYKAFNNLKKKEVFNLETLLLAVENYKKTKNVQQGYIKHASTFLNDNPFENELLTVKNVTSYKTANEVKQSQKESKQDIVNRIMDLHSQLTRLEQIAKAGDAYIEGYGFKGIEDIDNKCMLIRQELSKLNQELNQLNNAA